VAHRGLWAVIAPLVLLFVLVAATRQQETGNHDLAARLVASYPLRVLEASDGHRRGQDRRGTKEYLRGAWPYALPKPLRVRPALTSTVACDETPGQ
jgi:hypothetical protein